MTMENQADFLHFFPKLLNIFFSNPINFWPLCVCVTQRGKKGYTPDETYLVLKWSEFLKEGIKECQTRTKQVPHEE